jgi:hypothetical protein
MRNNNNKMHGATLAGIFGLALSSLLLLCGAGVTPTGTEQTSDVNANGFSLTNAATVQAGNVYANNVAATNSLTLPSSFVLATSHGGTGTNAPGLVAGTNMVITGSWPNQTVNASSGAVAWELKSSSFTAVAGHKYQVDTTSGGVTVTLPASASVMDTIEIADATLNWNTHNVTLGRNGLKINNGTADYAASVQGNKLSVVYISAGYGWSIK